jgi:mono/diheme cytochrome c family protein
MKLGRILVFGVAAFTPACSDTIISQPELVPGFPPPPVIQPGPPIVLPLPPGRLGTAPPPISGGTLIVAADGKTAVAADPDRDKVYVVDLKARKLLHTVALDPGDEPGRLAEDSSRRVHVALRSGGALLTINIDSGVVVGRRSVCGAPRGVAYDSANDLVHVACAEGELRSFPAKGGPSTRSLSLGVDLRDVVVQGDRLFVSRFKASELIELDASGSVVRKTAPPEFVGTGFDAMGQQITLYTPPTVAWRTVGLPSGGVAMVHTRSLTNAIETDQPGGYGNGPCKGGIVNSTISVLDDTVHAPSSAMFANVLPVDMAVSKDGSQVAVVDASALPGMGFPSQVSVGPLSNLSGECGSLNGTPSLSGQITAVAFDGQNRVVVQSREPAALVVLPDIGITLSTESKRDEGHDLFHGATKSLIACASCHPEAGEDGHVWNFASAGPRRTQSIRGGILGTAPFHWSGDMKDFTHLTEEVMTRRMNGPGLTSKQVASLGSWIDAQPRLPAPPAQDPEAVKRGRALFNSPEVGCSGCHSGDKLTSNVTVDVGTEGSFQVPSLLGVAYRAPFLHTGCAPTLRDRFGACGGGDKHGHTSQLSEQQIDDLTALLGTL